MPRGVPASGKRQPRAVAASQFEAETSVAGGTLDFEDGVVASAEEEAPAVDATPDSLIHEVVEDRAEPVLTAEQQEIKSLRDQLAKLSGKKDVEPVYDEAPADGEIIRIHFLEDGLTVNGRLMYRGEELEFVVGSQAHKDTFDKLGRSWLDYRLNEFGQVDRYGKIFFRNGPWPGKTYADGTYESLKAIAGDGSIRPPTEEEIAAAEKARARRAAPRLPSLNQS